MLSHRRIYLGILSLILAGSAVRATGLAPAVEQTALAQGLTGTIAYVRPNDDTGDEIHLIEPDGTGDRVIWSTQREGVPLIDDVAALAWRPDAAALAFASRHDETCSFYNSDLYVISSTGSDYRRVTAPPACARTGLPTGTVEVTLDNMTGTSGPFVVYFEGAPAPQALALPPGQSTTLVFNGVLDYGSRVQWAVAVLGEMRYHSSTGKADVKPGGTAYAEVRMWGGVDDWGWRDPTWRSDGRELGYVFGPGTFYRIAADNTTPGAIGQYLLSGSGGLPSNMPGNPKLLAWAPLPALANQLLYAGYGWGYGNAIFRVTEGSTTPGEVLVEVDGGTGEVVLGLAWLPDGSGFLFSATTGVIDDEGHLYRYDFDTQEVTDLIGSTDGFVRRLSVSPDGQRVVFEFQTAAEWTDLNAPIDLWLMDLNTLELELLVENGRSPAWSQQEVPEPVRFNHRLFLPLIGRSD